MAGKRQAEIPGTERPNSIPELDGAAEKLKASSKKRKQWQDTEIEDRDLVVRLMEKHNLEVYEDKEAGLIITLDTKVKAKVVDIDEHDAKQAKDGAADQEGDESEPSAESLKKLEGKASKKSKSAEA